MKSTVSKIEVVSTVGTFTFNEYQSVVDFEKNNWKMLGEVSYNVFRLYEDGVTAQTTHSGINASAYLACDIEEQDIDC